MYSPPIFAGSITLSWDAPTTNQNGTPLTDLAGYKLYYGTASGNYTNVINVGNVTTRQVNNLTSGLTYYFAVTAYDTSGNESGYSNEVSRTVYSKPPPAPDITVTDTVVPVNDLKIYFGTITAGSIRKETVKIKNNGNATLTIGRIAQADRLTTPFSIVNDRCSGRAIIPSSSCSFTVRFSPPSTGVFYDTFDIPSNDPDENPVIITLSGMAAAVPMPDISVTDSVAPANDHQISFGSIIHGIPSDHRITITNSGKADLLIGDIAQIDMLSAPFSILSDKCSGHTIRPSSSCTFMVRFYPDTAGSFTDTFDIPSNDPDEVSVIFTVKGTGLPPASNNHPSIPQLVYPANNQQDLETIIEFRWGKSSDPEGDMVLYDLYICEDETFTTGCVTKTGIAFYREEEIYYAGIPAGSALMIFMGIILKLAGSLRNRRKLPLLIAVIVISAAVLISCGGGGSSGSEGGIIGDSYASTYDSDTYNEISQIVSGLERNTTYYWKVVASDSNGAVINSLVWSFSTK